MQLGFIGLGKMGSRMVERLVLGGHEVVAWNRSGAPAQVLKLKVKSAKFKVMPGVRELVQELEKPRVVWSMLPAGEVTQNILEEIETYAESGDIIIDGGNAKWTDTQGRFDHFAGKGIRYLGIGVSGGLIAFETGYPLMVGGDKVAYEAVQPILASLSKPQGGYEYFGTGGAGHFVKMVHNAIEYSYMQGIGEGFGVLQNAQYNFDLVKVANLYRRNTLVSGFMMDRTADALQNDPKLEHIDGVIGKASGETIWTIDEAKKHDLFVENIEQALEFRDRSETDEKIQKSFVARLVSALRHEFGGHTVQKK